MSRLWGVYVLVVFSILAIGVRFGDFVFAQSASGVTSLVSRTSDGEVANGESRNPSISADGRFVVFTSQASNLTGFTNGSFWVLIHDRDTGTTTLIPQSGNGNDPQLTPDGRYLVFSAAAGIVVYDQTLDAIELLSTASGVTITGYSPSITPDGRYIAFHSSATNLIPSDANGSTFDVFLYDRQTQSLRLVSQSTSGVQGNSFSDKAVISADGRFVAFRSNATNLVANDSNVAWDIFVYDMLEETTELLSRHTNGQLANNHSDFPSISSDGTLVAFASQASNLVDGDNNGVSDIFLRNRTSGQTVLVSRSSASVIGNGYSDTPYLTPDGQYVAFTSSSTNLVEPDANGTHHDIFISHLSSGTIDLASRRASGLQANSSSGNPAVSGDGRFVAFTSSATNLVDDDTNNKIDIFVRDRSYNTTCPPCTISGTVAETGASKLKDVLLTTDTGYSVYTDKEGRYNLFGLPAGTHIVSPSKADFLFDPPSWAVTVPPDTSNINFSGRSLSTISGVVLDTLGDPVQGVSITTDAGHTAVTDETGTYVLSDIYRGSYIVTPSKPGLAFQPRSHTLAVPPHAQGIDFEASTAFSVSGFVREADGTPVQGALVRGDGLTAPTDSQGFYQLDGLTTGEHNISAWKIGWFTDPETQIVSGPPDVSEINFTGSDYNETGIEMISLSSIGEQANEETQKLYALSDDGRFALFCNRSDNMASALTDFGCLFRRDRLAGTTESVLSTNYPPYGDFVMGGSGDMSSDGSVVVFTHGEPFPPSYPNDFYADLFVRDYGDNSVTRIFAPDGSEFDQGVSGRPLISGNGEIILFKSSATNILAGNTWSEDLYVYDRASNTFSRITQRQSQGGDDDIRRMAMSTDGRYVLFSSLDTSFVPGEAESGLIHIYRYDRIQDAYQLIHSYGEFDITDATDINLNGRYIVMTLHEQVVVFDSLNKTFRLVSMSPEGSPANGITVDGAISDDGRYVVFASVADNLVPIANPYGILHLYLADLETNTIALIDSGILGENANDNVGRDPLITSNGQFVGFISDASNLVVGDENGYADAFLKMVIADGDADGIDSQVEEGAPNNGDGNNDGLPDSEQEYVASLPNNVNSQYVTLESPVETSIHDAVAGDNPDPAGSPQGIQFPIGFLSFGLTGLSNGAAAAVTLIPEGGVTSTTYYKYGPTADNPADHWYEFLYDGSTGAEFFADRIVLHFVDGLRGDGDLTANGAIVDPGGPAYTGEVQEIILQEGWNLVSTWVDPVYACDMDALFEPVEEQLVLIKDELGQVYWPDISLNDIGCWQPGHGYQVYMTSGASWPIEGTAIDPQAMPLDLEASWSIIAYLRQEPQAIEQALATIQDKLVLIKDGKGGIYWPAYGVNQIGQMVPGQGYQVYLEEAGTLTYPAND